MEHSNKYIFIYSIVMVVVIAVSLTVVAVQLKPAQEDNIRIEKMQNILTSVNVPIASVPKKQIIEVYHKYITTAIGININGDVVEQDAEKVFAIDLANEFKKPAEKQILPVFTATLDGGDTAVIVPLRGKGLWGPVWGYISFKTDYNTVFGTMFDHKGETPGLGAEINQPFFMNPFKGKTIFDQDGKFTSIQIVKGGAADDNPHGVDAISGGTITSKGVEKMIFDNLTSYQAYINKQKKK
ncbi:MAG: NADH:ubiquinone reductase (Na(+)-transporting) subunit C [Bacteroidales bacterium]|nr:NADH:ubiquinone reductase (Na(+)-transporting) subunit C [Bacteroidales bacterium]